MREYVTLCREYSGLTSQLSCETLQLDSRRCSKRMSLELTTGLKHFSHGQQSRSISMGYRLVADPSLHSTATLEFSTTDADLISTPKLPNKVSIVTSSAILNNFQFTEQTSSDNEVVISSLTVFYTADGDGQIELWYSSLQKVQIPQHICTFIDKHRDYVDIPA